VNGVTYTFASWSDGGSATHNITVPAAGLGLTATYTSTSTTSWLSDLAFTTVANGWGPVEKDRSNGESAAGDGNPITLNGTVYAKGLGVHAASDVRYAANGTCTAFSAKVGVDDEEGTKGSVVFQVFADGTKLADSGLMTGSTATKTLTADITGRTTLQLVVTNGGDSADYDHADWAEAAVTCTR
jgi:alpha-galactosidase